MDEMWKRIEEWHEAAEASMIGMDWPPPRSSTTRSTMKDHNLSDDEKKAILAKVGRAALKSVAGNGPQGKDSPIASFKESGISICISVKAS